MKIQVKYPACVLLTIGAYLLFNRRSSNSRKSKGNVPLLDQSVDLVHNSKILWVSMSFCYAKALDHSINSASSVKAVFAAKLWSKKTGGNVVLQVYNDTAIKQADMEVLNLIKDMPGCYLFLSPGSPSALCDCALAHSVGRALLHTLPSLAHKITDQSVVLLANIGVFITKPNMFNVIKSGHGSWMFGSEAVTYMHSPWPTVFIAMTVQRWKLVTQNSNSCAELVANSPILSKYYQPPWLGNKNNTDNTDIDIMMAVHAMEKFITRNLLMLHICQLPEFNKVWSDLEASDKFDILTEDVDTCWKGMGNSACMNQFGYWHYPGLSGCNYWSESFPEELLDQEFSELDPIKSLVRDQTDVLFSSK